MRHRLSHFRGNPFRIPRLNRMHRAVLRYVRRHQGPEGYIDTQDIDCDTIYTFIYNYDAFQALEMRIHGVRVNPRNGDLEILFHGDNTPRRTSIVYDKEDFNAPDADWRSVKYDETVYYIPTIFNIAEYIREYA